METVLITGAAGFIGSHLCDRFLKEGYFVIGIDSFLTGSPNNIAHLFGHPNFKFIKYDVTNYIYVKEKIDLILHFACPASPVDYLNHPIHTMKVDSLGTIHTLGLAKEKRARYLLASTSEIYGDPKVHPQPETYWGNVNPVGPRSVYDEAKRFSEALSMAYMREHGIDVRIARIFNTYGPRMRINDGRVVPNFIIQALKGEPLTVYGDGTQTRSFCYIDDLVEGIFRLAVKPDLKGEVINLGNPEEYKIIDFAMLIKEVLNSSLKVIFKPLPPNDPKRRRPDIEKAKKLLNWEPKVSLRDGLKRTIEWFREKLQQNGGKDIMKKALVCGAGGFIGHHMVRRLKKEGFWVRGVDLKYPEFCEVEADDFVIGDLRDPYVCKYVVDQPFDEIYQFAADMGGAGYVFTGENDANIMHNSALINLNMLEACYRRNCKRIFYSSSACIYPKYNQEDPHNPNCAEDSAYPAMPDSEYGWEKLFSERLYLAFHRNYGIEVRIARYHNIFGPEGSWNDGREKAPAALCRKVATAILTGKDYIEVWGDGKQTRSFLYIDECIEGTIRLMRSNWTGPVNIGSEEMVTIDQLAEMIMDIAGKKLAIKHVPGPQGVRGRNSDNRLIYEKLGWRPTQPLRVGLEITYRWIEEQVRKSIKQT